MVLCSIILFLFWGAGGSKMKKNNGEKKIYIRPEDVCELILDKLSTWKTQEVIKENIAKILWYLKNEKFDKLQTEFGLDN